MYTKWQDVNLEHVKHELSTREGVLNNIIDNIENDDCSIDNGVEHIVSIIDEIFSPFCKKNY